MFGWRLSSYRTLGRALVTIISLQIGIFNYDEVLFFPNLSIIYICRPVFVTFTVKFQRFSGFERSPPAGRTPLWFMHRIHVVYGAQSPHIGHPGGILQ